MANITPETGRGGKTFEDRQLAGEVRRLGLAELKKILLLEEDTEYKKAVVLRLAGTLLPRLNEHGGMGGGPIEYDDYSQLSNEELERRLQIVRGGKDFA